MKIYGVTLVDTNSIDGWGGKESSTWLFSTEEEQLEKAWEVGRDKFMYSFEDEDTFGNKLPEKDDFIKKVSSGGYMAFIREESHFQIETFEQEL